MVFAGEMLGTVHRVLLETHQNELKPGSVLLLKQVGELLKGPATGGAPGCPFLASCLPSTASLGEAKPWFVGAESNPLISGLLPSSRVNGDGELYLRVIGVLLGHQG